MHRSFRLRSGTLGCLAATVALATLAAGPALASDVTFAQYFQTTGAEQWAISTSGTTTTATADGSVFFLFQNVSGLPFAGPELATFSLTATSTTLGNCATTCGNADGFTQTGYSGSFSFIDAGSDPGADLLSGVFQVVGTGAQFSSVIGTTGGSFDASASASDLNQLVMTSAFLNLTGQTEEDASWSLSSLIPSFAITVADPGQGYPATGPFNAAGAGTFSSNPGPTVGAPEPATFALIGSAFIALGMLRRKKLSRS
jgi:hypothetical protein